MIFTITTKDSQHMLLFASQKITNFQKISVRKFFWHYSRPGRLKALVMKATSNKCMDYYRKASSRQESYTIDDEENAYEPVDEKSNPEARILRMEEEKYQKLVLNRLRKRNPMNYDILVKTKLHELSAAEVASEYGITPNNVNNRNLRSKAWIIEEMEKICRQSH